MTNTYAIFVNGIEYNCSYSFNMNKKKDVIDVSNSMTREYIGEMYDYTLPEIDDEEYIGEFEKELETFIKSKIK